MSIARWPMRARAVMVTVCGMLLTTAAFALAPSPAGATATKTTTKTTKQPTKKTPKKKSTKSKTSETRAGVLGGPIVLGWGNNEYGQLGTGLSDEEEGATPPTEEEVPVTTEEEVPTGNPEEPFEIVTHEGKEVITHEGKPGKQPATNTAIRVAGIEGVKEITTSGSTTIALLSDGTVEAWGENDLGSLGDGQVGYPYNRAEQKNPVPVQVSAITNAVQVSGEMALLANGTVMTWGAGGAGQLGDGKENVPGHLEAPYYNHFSTVPAQVSGLTNVKSIWAGSGTRFALLEDGSVMAWGANPQGDLGIGSVEETVKYDGGIAEANAGGPDTPVEVPGLSGKGVVSISSSGERTYAVLANGTVLGMGLDPDAKQEGAVDVPTPIPGLENVKEVDAVNQTALLDNGTVVEWGAPPFQEGGTVRAVPNVENAVAILGSGGNIALLSNGTMEGWGTDYGLGNGFEPSPAEGVNVPRRVLTTPTPVVEKVEGALKPVTGVTQISGGLGAVYAVAG